MTFLEYLQGHLSNIAILCLLTMLFVGLIQSVLCEYKNWRNQYKDWYL